MELSKTFKMHTSKDAKVVTDKWKSYQRMGEECNITQEKSKLDKIFNLIHRGIQQLKSWIRGIHRSVDERYLKAYLYEFCYRINRSIHKDTIFDYLIQRMVFAQPMNKNQLKKTYCN